MSLSGLLRTRPHRFHLREVRALLRLDSSLRLGLARFVRGLYDSSGVRLRRAETTAKSAKTKYSGRQVPGSNKTHEPPPPDAART